MVHWPFDMQISCAHNSLTSAMRSTLCTSPMSCQYNHPIKLLIAHIIAAIKTPKHNIIVRKVRAITNIMGNNKAYKLAKQSAKNQES